MPDPFFDEGGVQLYLGDAFEILPQLKSDVDLVIADPPYGQSYQSQRRRQRLDVIAGDDGSFATGELLRLCCQRLRRGRHVYVFGPDDQLDQAPLAAACRLVWDKCIVGTGDLSLPWALTHEPITFAVYEPSKANREKGYGRLAARMRQGSVLVVPRRNGAATGRHPTEKPVRLLRMLIESSSCIDELVLDPVVGSGSTLVAAVLEGRSAVGIDIDEKNCEIAAERVRRAATAAANLEAAA